MNRDKQMVKNAENKQAQARENYSKNKQILSETKVREKAETETFEYPDMNNDIREDVEE